MTAMDVVHHKVLLAEELETARYRSMLDTYIRDERDNADTPMFDIATHAWAPDTTGESEAIDMAGVLRMSKSFWVSPDMVEVAYAAAATMPPEPLLPQDLPAPQGFLWLAQPYRMLDIRRKALSMSAIMWTIRGGRVRIWHFTDRHDPDDSVNLQVRERFTQEEWDHLPELNLNHCFEITVGAELPQGLTWDIPVPPGAQVAITHQVVEGGHQYVWATDQELDINDPPRLVPSPLALFVLTVWRLMQQTLTTVVEEQIPRWGRRQLRRARMREDPVSIVLLRRRPSRSDEDRPVEWSHQWLVDGHWHRYWCGKRGEERYVRWVWVHAYVKGPEGAPLIIRDKVQAWVR